MTYYSKRGQTRGFILHSDIVTSYRNYYRQNTTRLSQTEFENEIMKGNININDYLDNTKVGFTR